MTVLAAAEVVQNGGNMLSYAVTVAVALVSGTGGWSALQFIINRKGRTAEAARLTAQTEQAYLETQQAEAKRQQILADLQARAQQIAIESAANAYERVTKECDNCRAELKDLRRATETLVRLVENALPFLLLVDKVVPDDFEARVRVAISMVRDNL